MNKILNITQLENVAQDAMQKKQNIVLVGGCFDLVHKGHIAFLNQARKSGDLLFLLLESDENIRIMKGDKRPINSQLNRSIVLSTLESVNYIIPLKGVTKNEEYDKLIVLIQPNVIAITIGDSQIEKREKQCKMVDAKLVLIDRLDTPSTTKLLEKT